jgi:hypothetical protein
MAFLQQVTAKDLGVFLNGKDFVAVQSMRERFRQEITRRGGFGSDGPIIQSVRAADEGTVSFSFILLREGALRGLNSYRVLWKIRDFEIQTKKGTLYESYSGCNWTDIDIDSGLDQVMINVDVSIPGINLPV